MNILETESETVARNKLRYQVTMILLVLTLSTAAFSREKKMPDFHSLPFEFCRSATGLNLNNAYWLAVLSYAQYFPPEDLAPLLESIGFGNPGDGQWFQKQYLEWQIKVAKEKTEGERFLKNIKVSPNLHHLFSFNPLERDLDILLTTYREIAGHDFIDDGRSSSLTLEKIENNPKPGRMIEFFSTYIWDPQKTEFERGSLQVLWAYHPVLDMVLVSFRGTERNKMDDIWTDLQFPKSAVISGSEEWGTSHKGALDSLETIEPILTKKFEELKHIGNKTYKLWVTGHSLGGMLGVLWGAKLLAADWARNEHDPSQPHSHFPLKGIYTYGMPNLGDLVFVNTLKHHTQISQVPVIRFRNRGDNISRSLNTIYEAVGALVYFGSDQKMYFGEDLKVSFQGLRQDVQEFQKTLKGSFEAHYMDHYISSLKGELQKTNDPRWKDCQKSTNDGVPAWDRD